VTTVVSPAAEACAGLLVARAEHARYVWYQCRLVVAAERLWNAHGVDALQALQAGEVDLAAEVERNWP
jgi:hypothetical protein